MASRKRRRDQLAEAPLAPEDDIGEPAVGSPDGEDEVAREEQKDAEHPDADRRIRRDDRDLGLGLPDADTFRILIATDNHLGYKENDPITKNDSHDTFEEILQIAVDNQVDFLLLGGDLFHENKPSRHCIYRAQTLFKRYCFGDRPIGFQIISDQKRNFPSTQTANYEDPNVNISLPVFSIHGNHDDPAGRGGLSAMDLLHSGSLLNYFGKAEKVDDIEIHPILLQKGRSKISLYGLGNIRDERLHNTFKKKKVTLMRPADEPQGWYNIFVIHQNRTQHSSVQKTFIPETFLPDFIDFVIWGHEHECRVDPEESEQGFWVCQPGSSVATSISAGEAVQKRVAIMEIRRQPGGPSRKRSRKRRRLRAEDGGEDSEAELSEAAAEAEQDPEASGEEDPASYQYRVITEPLRTVRSMMILDVKLGELLSAAEVKLTERMDELLSAKVEEMIVALKREWLAQPWRLESETEADFPLPLVRVRVDHTGFPKLNVQRFGGKFVGRVANPEDLLSLHKQRKQVVGGRRKVGDDEAALAEVDLEAKAAELIANGGDPEAPPPIHEMVGSLLAASNRSLSLLSEVQLGRAVSEFVQKHEAQAITSFVKDALQRLQLELEQDTVGRPGTRQSVLDAVAERRQRQQAQDRVVEAAAEIQRPAAAARQAAGQPAQVAAAARVRVKREGRSPARGRARGRTLDSSEEEDSDFGPDAGGGDGDDDDYEEEAAVGRSARPGRRAASRSSAKPKPRAAAAASSSSSSRRRKQQSSEEEDDESDEEDERPAPVSRRGALQRTAAARRSRRLVIDIEDEEEPGDDEDFQDQAMVDESEIEEPSDEDFAAPRRRTAAAAKKSAAAKKKPAAARAPKAATAAKAEPKPKAASAPRGRKAAAEDDLGSLIRARAARPKREPAVLLQSSVVDMLSLDLPPEAPRVKQERSRR